MEQKSPSVFNVTVIVAALGYFVDIYDLLLFQIVRVKSLESLGFTGVENQLVGEYIINWQMMGLLIGGIIWGIMGDKKGRLSVLFGSIVLYSLANIATGFIETKEQYGILRFIAGVGLAGELGAGITLVAELLPKEKRGIGTSLVAGIGLLGAVLANLISKTVDWRYCYFVGGGLGFMLLILRISVFESSMFSKIKDLDVKKGSLMMFFNNGDRFRRYICSILIGLPTWFVIGVLVAFSKEFAEKIGVQGAISPGDATMYAYAGISVGDVLIGFVSKWLQSRKKALYLFYALTLIGILIYFFATPSSVSGFYMLCAYLGFSSGFWAIFVTMGAEQFGTNLRATAATTVPNMVRGALPLIIGLFKYLRGENADAQQFIQAGLITGGIVMAISITAAIFTKETYGKDLNYVER
ncbi:MAG: MFS transporter [Chitinophagaceae bacterium]|nr:MAG: MFS transporter [Chitinophagaceae bacterium]